MRQTTNKVLFKKSDYDSMQGLLSAISEQVALLTKNNYMSAVYRSFVDKNIYVVEFSSADMHLSTLIPIWVTAEEAVNIASTLNISHDDDVDDFDVELLGKWPKNGDKGGNSDA